MLMTTKGQPSVADSAPARQTTPFRFSQDRIEAELSATRCFFRIGLPIRQREGVEAELYATGSAQRFRVRASRLPRDRPARSPATLPAAGARQQFLPGLVRMVL